MPSVDEPVPRGIRAHGRDGNAIAKDDIPYGEKQNREDPCPQQKEASRGVAAETAASQRFTMSRSRRRPNRRSFDRLIALDSV